MMMMMVVMLTRTTTPTTSTTTLRPLDNVDGSTIHTVYTKTLASMNKKKQKDTLKSFLSFYIVDGFGVILSIFLCIQFILHSNTFK